MLARLLDYDAGSLREHRVISLTGLHTVGPRIQSSGIVVDALGIAKPWHIPTALIRLILLIRRERPDIVQTWMYHADLIGGVAARLAGCQNVVWNLRTDAFPRSAFKLQTRLLQRLCAVMGYLIPRRIIAASRAGLDSHVAIGYPRLQMLLIGNGFIVPEQKDLDAARLRIRLEWGLLPEDCAIGMVGRFDMQKGQENFIRAAAIVAKDHPKARFFIIGRNCDSENARMREWVQETGLQDRISLLGERNDIADCLGALDVFCLPSLVEGFPNALGEAMAAGLTCVTTAAGAAEELLDGHGPVVPVADSSALAHAISRLAGMTPAQRRVQGQGARCHIIRKYSLDKIVALYIQLYQLLLASRARPSYF